MQHLSSRLKRTIDQAVTILGEIIRAETGPAGFQRVERIRRRMAGLRHASHAKKTATLRQILDELEGASARERMACARAFTLMLEVMNAAENAYRNYSIRQKELPLGRNRPDAVIYVLTAHPTEARAPENIWIFHELQKVLSGSIATETAELDADDRAAVRNLLSLAWHTRAVRSRKPRVEDEAEHVFSTLLREETLRTLLLASQRLAPVFVRSWVGGDKDGHPGVNETTFRHSLQISRGMLLRFVKARLAEIRASVEITGILAVENQLRKLESLLPALKGVDARDGARIRSLRTAFRQLLAAYESSFDACHPALTELQRLFQMFPALVVPLELRESSDRLPAAVKKRSEPISRMLDRLGKISRGGDPRWYARGMIISMAETIEHIRMAAKLTSRALGGIRIPVIPLFEQAEALNGSAPVISAFLKDPKLNHARKKYWQGYLEVMVGYSDSSKQSGVLPSRLEIAEAMHQLDRLCRSKNATPLFFQGSGGSVDRGGGSIAEQTAWWPSGALRNYKVTIQGEMVERSLASPEITWRQIQRIADSAGHWKQKRSFRYRPVPAVQAMADRVAQHYRAQVADPAFLKIIGSATPYLFLDKLRLGSRPTKRTKTLTVSGLRAIPWVLCWTQTRILFPTWWGVGSAWRSASATERKSLRSAFGRDEVFTVFVRALDYTFAKIELPVFQMYIERSALSLADKESALTLFLREFELTKKFLQEILRASKNDPRAWLKESIELRSPMIHPLNLLQLLALEKNETDLLRLTVTGIANGMVATG